MPHVIINGNIDFDLIHDSFQRKVHQYSLNDNTSILKLTDSYQNNLNYKILIHTISIENNFTTEYFVELIKKSNQITIRLFPTTYPDDKTANIMRSLAFVLQMIKEANIDKNFEVLKTNIQPYLDEFLER